MCVCGNTGLHIYWAIGTIISSQLSLSLLLLFTELVASLQSISQLELALTNYTCEHDVRRGILHDLTHQEMPTINDHC